jgi:hypothetical protein
VPNGFNYVSSRYCAHPLTLAKTGAVIIKGWLEHYMLHPGHINQHYCRFPSIALSVSFISMVSVIPKHIAAFALGTDRALYRNTKMKGTQILSGRDGPVKVACGSTIPSL